MNIKVTLNSDKFVKAMKKRSKVVDNEIDKGIIKAGFLYHKAVVKSFPVDTGRARSSVFMRRGKHFALIGTNVFYALYLERGTGIYAKGGRQTPWKWKGSGKKWKGWHTTRGMKPKWMFRNSLENEEDGINRLIREGLRRGLAKS